MLEFHVIDLSVGTDPQPINVSAANPEEAARKALGEELVRSGAKRALRAKVYYQRPGEPRNMVRLYNRLADLAGLPDL